MAICRRCYLEVVAPLQTEGGKGVGIKNSFPSRMFKLYWLTACQLSTESRRAVFRLAAQNDDWDTLTRHVLENRKQDQIRERRKDSVWPEKESPTDTLEIARHRYEAINEKRFELLKPGEAWQRKMAEIEAERVETSQRKVEATRALDEELERQEREGENCKGSAELEYLRYEQFKASLRLKESEKEKNPEIEFAGSLMADTSRRMRGLQWDGIR